MLLLYYQIQNNTQNINLETIVFINELHVG